MLLNKFVAPKKIIRLTLFALSVFSISAFTTPTVSAGIWGESIVASVLKQVLEALATQIEGMLLGALK